MTRVVLFTGIAGLLFGCGGNLAPPPLRSFNYGAPTAADGNQQSTADSAQSGMNSILSSPGNTSSASAAPTLTDSLASSLPESLLSEPMNALPGTSSVAVATAGRDGLLRSLRSPALQADCAKVTDTSITYDHCTYDSSGYSGTLEGSITVAANSVSWDITFTFSISTQGVSGNGYYNWKGQMAWTATTITGNGRSAFTVHASGNGQSADLASTTGVDLNLTYEPSPSFCITGGTLELRRVVAASGGTENVMKDAAIKFTWNGCGNVTVATGT